MGIGQSPKVEKLVRLPSSSTFYRTMNWWSLVWHCGPLMVAVFTLFSIYMCGDIALKAIIIWMCVGDDHPNVKSCLISYSSCDLSCIANVTSIWMTMLGFD